MTPRKPQSPAAPGESVLRGVHPARHSDTLRDDVAALRARLDEAEETLRAIRSGEVDALVAEEALRESEEKLRVLFDSSKDAFMTLAPPTWRFTSGNPSTIALFRAKDEAEFISKTPWDLSPEHQPDGRTSCEKARQMIETAMREGNHYFDWTHKRFDGEEFPASVLLTRLRLKGQMLLNATVRDVTERKRAEDALRRSNLELQQFAYVVSHDLQEPLRMVSSYVELLASRYRGRLDADADDFIAFAVEGATRMQQLIDALLKYSRVGTQTQEFSPTVCDTVFERALSDLQVMIETTHAVITHDPLPTVMADRVQLGQVLQNLISNAIKFHGAAPPRIHVSAARRAGAWQFAVRDNGIGIDPEHFERIFVIFQRLHGRDAYPGTGIGLAVCKRIVERHGGRIWVESEPGKGATFFFTIPEAGATREGP